LLKHGRVLVKGLSRLLKSPLRHPETIKSDGTQRRIWSSAPFVEDSMSIDRDYFSLSLLFGDN